MTDEIETPPGYPQAVVVFEIEQTGSARIAV